MLNGYIERNNKNLIPTEKGISIIKIIDEKLKSPKLTADWEVKLQQIEKGLYDNNTFLKEIVDFTKNIIINQSVDNEVISKIKSNNLDIIGTCPICYKKVYETEKTFTCEDKCCRFVIFKNSKFFVDKKANLTKSKVKELLSKGNVKMKFFSSKTNKQYEATVRLDITEKYINFKMEF